MKVGRDRGDRGAVAILVAIMAVLLVGMAAFAVDFGMAYANKTSLQKAADAAALAVAGRIIKLSAPTDDCTAVHDAYANRTAYHSSANLYTDLNATGDGIAVANNPQSR
ncbi:MAG TPA: pilus assembly protein TadG-related protein, partial [Candidatus Angelobacter sp.]|nr:pilus assembly protein TadG-related protein [Candidatus Angelobacter sp.]